MLVCHFLKSLEQNQLHLFDIHENSHSFENAYCDVIFIGKIQLENCERLGKRLFIYAIGNIPSSGNFCFSVFNIQVTMN